MVDDFDQDRFIQHFHLLCRPSTHPNPCAVALQAELGPALQVFYNLKGLPAVVLESVAAAVKEAREATARALDPLALEKGRRLAWLIWLWYGDI